MNTPPLPIGKVKTGTGKKLNLTDGIIKKGAWYQLPPTADGKTTGKVGRVTHIQMMATLETNDVEFAVRLQEDNGQGWVFNFQPE